MALILQNDTTLAEVIWSKAISIGLDVCILNCTPGDGDCFYHAVLEGMSAKNLNVNHVNAMQLRRGVVDFVFNSWDEVNMPHFITAWLLDQDPQNRSYHYFHSICLNQYIHGRYATELFIAGAARLLQIAILVTTTESTEQWKYSTNYPLDTFNSQYTLDSFPYILIGHSDSSVGPEHFQSLFFTAELDSTHTTTTSFDQSRIRSNINVEVKNNITNVKSLVVSLDDIPVWSPRNHRIPWMDKISLWQGDITTLNIECIVNAANSNLRKGGGVDGAIHSKAGPLLQNFLNNMHCSPGMAVLTPGFKLPASYIIHTVAPTDKNEKTLENCYTSCLRMMTCNNIRSIAFCCLGTGIYSFDHQRAAHIALRTVKNFLPGHYGNIDRIIFCVYEKNDFDIYMNLMSEVYFPFPTAPSTTAAVDSQQDSREVMASSADIDFHIEYGDNEQKKVKGPKSKDVSLVLVEKGIECVQSIKRYQAELLSVPAKKSRNNIHQCDMEDEKLREDSKKIPCIGSAETESKLDQEKSRESMCDQFADAKPQSEALTSITEIKNSTGTSKRTTSKIFIDTEKKLQEECIKLNVSYIGPGETESKWDQQKRRKSMRDQFVVVKAQSAEITSVTENENSTRTSKRTMSKKFIDTEKKLQEECIKLNVPYIGPDETESKWDQEKRRKSLRNQVVIAKAELDEVEHFTKDSHTVPDGYSHLVMPEMSESSHLSERRFNEHEDNPRNSSLDNIFLQKVHSSRLVHEMMSRFSLGELNHKIGKCKICQEVRPIFHKTAPSSKFAEQNRQPLKIANIWEFDASKDICKRCEKNLTDIQKSKRDQVARFSGVFSCGTDRRNHNNMNFLKVPPFLKNLRLIEKMMIRRITVYMNIHSLKYGMLASKGHSISIPQDMKIHSKLPLLPDEVGVLILRSGKTRSKLYLANRKNVEDALIGLVYGYPAGGLLSLAHVDNPNQYVQYTGKDHVDGTALNGRYFEYCPNSFYHDVEIDNRRLETLSNIDSIVDLPTITTNTSDDDLPDNGTAKDQYDTLEVDEEIASYSGIVCPFELEDADQLLKKKLKDMIDDDVTPSQYISAGKVAEFPFTNRGEKKEKPMPEMKVEGFWTMCYPHVFVNGSCDITIKSQCNIDYDEWVQHIYYTSDNRVPSDPFLKFHLMNIGLKKKALNQGSFVISQRVNDSLITVDELKSRIDDGDESIPRTIINFGSNLINTDPFWKARKHENQALNFYQLYRYSMLPVWFDTNSNAEHHWEPLHHLIIKFHAMINGTDEKLVQEEFFSNSAFRHMLLAENCHIVTNYFHARDMNYKNTVAKELFDWTDIWVRDEFAKLRGQIHSHSIMFSKSHYSKVNEIMSRTDVDASEKARLLHSWLQTDAENTDTLFSPGIVSMHPAGGNYDVEGKWIPNKHRWTMPEGSNAINPDCLKKSFHCATTDDDREQFQIDVVNKCMIHGCSGYCLKPSKKLQKADSSEPLDLLCRFHYGVYDRKLKMSSGKDANLQPTITDGTNPRYEGPRDHPRMVQHVAARPLSWLGNCDSSIIIHQNLQDLNHYLTGYACKGAATTSELISMFKTILEKSPSSSSLKSVAQKMMMKAVGCVDTPAATADYFNTGNKPVSSTRLFNRIGLSGYKVLSKNVSKNGIMMATKSTVLDKFLSQDRRNKHGNDITLYEWACICTCAAKKKCHAEHVPVFTGFPNYCSWPVSEEYARAQLMMFSPGTWQRPNDLLTIGGVTYENFTTAFASFIDTQQCPPALRLMLTWAKEKSDKSKRTDVSNHGLISQHNETPASLQLSQNSISSSQNNAHCSGITLGQQLLDNILEQQQSIIDSELIVEDFAFDDGGPDYNWHESGLQSMLQYASLDTIEKCKTWLTKAKEKGCEQPQSNDGRTLLPTTNPLQVNKKQMYAVYMSIYSLFRSRAYPDVSQTLHRLIIQGSAGTGKSQVIKIITRLGIRICDKQKSVLNLAPTGAAAVILPNGRTVHSVANIPRSNGDSGHTIPVMDKPLSAQEMRKLKDVMGDEEGKLSLGVLNIDERGMVGQNLFGWTNARFAAGSNALTKDTNDDQLPFGQIPAVNLSGDIFQLSPIGDKDTCKIPGKSGTPIQWYGHLKYMQFEKCIILDEIMRQKPSQRKFIACLNNLREGNVKQSDWEKLNERSLSNLSLKERQQFEQDDTILLTETWAESYQRNCERIASLGQPVALCISTGRGNHHSREKDMGQIRNACYLSKGCRVMITKNQQALVALGLNNGAMGKVVDIYYDEGMQPPQLPSFVIVDIPGFKGIPGNECIPGHPTYVALTPDTGFCENKCNCQRTGYPLIPAYGITINKAQGMTIGQNEMIKKCVIKLSDKISMESKSLGLAYTAFSRVCEFTDFALQERIPWERLEYINHHKQMKSRKEEEKRLRDLERNTLESLQCTEYDYIQLLEAIDDFCQDDIIDSRCDETPEKCACIFHKSISFHQYSNIDHDYC